MPRIYITIGEFDKNVRSYPVTVQFPSRTSTRWLTKDQARGLWRSQDRQINDPDLSKLLFRALLEGLETDWSEAQPSLLQELSTDPVGQPSAIRIFLEIADPELNELPWELAVAGFGPNYHIIRRSESPVTHVKQSVKFPIQIIVIEARDPAEIPFPDEPFHLDEALRQIFGAHPELPSVFRVTQLTGASSEDFTAIVPARRFDIVHVAVRADWQAVSDTAESEGALRLAGATSPVNARLLFGLLASARTRLLILHLPSDVIDDSQPAIIDLAARVRTLSGPAILAVQSQIPNAPALAKNFFYSIYDAIVHDIPLDTAAFRATLKNPQVRATLFLPLDGEDLLRVSPLVSGVLESVQNNRDTFVSLKSRLQTAVLDPSEYAGLQKSIDDGLASLDYAKQRAVSIVAWDQESGGIVPLRQAIAHVEEAEMSYQAVAEKMDRAESSVQRVVNTHFQTDGVAVPPSDSLVADREYKFSVDIGPRSSTSNVASAKPIPEAYPRPFYAEAGVDLHICLFSQQFRLANDSMVLRLPRLGPSSNAEFTVFTPAQPGTARLRACVYHRQNLLQSILVVAQITPTLQSNLKDGNVAEVEFSLSDRLQNLENLPERELNILTNENADGTHTFAILGKQVKRQFSIDQGIEVKLAREKLLAICSTRDKKGNLEYLYRDLDNSGDEAKFVSDLKELAYLGWKLYCHFTMDSLDWDFESKLEAALKQPCPIQIASTRSARYVYPWSVVYDKRLIAGARNTVCTQALDLLRNGGPPGFLENVSCPQNGCAQAEDANVVCPFRFWGFKHAIEQPANSGEIVTEIPIAGDAKCVMAAHSMLHGVAHRKEIESECKVKADYNEAKTEIGTCLASAKPHIVYFFCHGGRTSSAPWLGVGNDEHIEGSDLKVWNVKWPDTRPLIIINGCHTVDLSPDDLLDFVTAFAWTRASGILGTEIAIPESLAREFGREFLRQFLSEHRVSDIMRRTRLSLLAKYNLLGLAYTPYCYGDLHVVRVH
jgi:hypothetical protein